MRRSGSADLPLHYGHVPRWLADRMATLGGSIVEAIVIHYGRAEVLRRLSDPYWFQAFGSLLGMDWHSSGITTSVMAALKRSINPISAELGLYVCGGRGKQSRRTPDELMRMAEQTGLDGTALVRSSRLTARVDNNAVQDGFQLYLHSFVVSCDGEWAVIQQGMNPAARFARRYHWLSSSVRSFVDTPHTAVVGENRGLILNLTHRDAEATRYALVELSRTHPDRITREARKILLPRRHEVKAADLQLKRLAAVLAVAHDQGVQDFASLLLCPGLGSRTLQSLALVSEVIHGTPLRFEDPARFSFAHGGKDGHPFPVPLKTYDQSIAVLKCAVGRARIGRMEKLNAMRCLDLFVQRTEALADPKVDLDRHVTYERRISPGLGGRTAGSGTKEVKPRQLRLDFEPESKPPA